MCELAARDLLRDTTLVIRPSMVVGPHDYTDRLGYWLRRVVAGGHLAPGPPEARLQLLDARDLASWLLQLVRAEATGTYNAAGRAACSSFADLLDTVARVSSTRPALVWLDAGFLEAAGETPEYIPLWPGARGATEIVIEKGVASGLRPRTLASTVRDVLRDFGIVDVVGPAGDWLSPTREAELLDAWACEGPA